MGKHSAPVAPSFWAKHKKIIFPVSLLAVLVAAGIVLAILFFSENPYVPLLEKAGVAFTDCEEKGDTLYLTFEGDAEGILQCRKALDVLRKEENPPKTLVWTLTNQGTPLTQGTVEHVGFLPAPESPRVETLEEDLTVLKLKYELEQSGLTVNVSCARGETQNGKILTVSVDGSPEEAKNALNIIPAALLAVNEEGGGIIQYTVLFTENGTLFAAAAYDLSYGDVLLSSKLAG